MLINFYTNSFCPNKNIGQLVILISEKSMSNFAAVRKGITRDRNANLATLKKHKDIITKRTKFTQVTEQNVGNKHVIEKMMIDSQHKHVEEDGIMVMTVLPQSATKYTKM